MIDVDRDAIVRVFIAEAEERLGRMEEALLAIEGSPDDPDLLGGIFRDAHTLKGNAVSLGFSAIADHAHALEDVLDRARQGGIVLGPDRVATLLGGVDALREALEGVAAGEGEPPRDGARVVAPGVSAEQRTLRVDIAKLDRLMDLASEIAIARGRVQQTLEAGAVSDALAAHRDSDRSFLDLQELILRARMVPVGPAFRAYARSVRDVAATHGKQARLVVEGDDVEVDTSIIEHLRDALTHMVRNALDHGIEAPALRRARGKDPCGTVRLRAFRQAGNIVIELSDDGGGLDRARIADRARAGGRADSAARASDAELHRLIFEPGFSTAEHVTELSGRGVGMDVVRRNVEALRGSVAVASREGQGTTFTIRLPLTLAIIDGFGTVAGGETYVVPTEAVIECLELPRAAGGPAEGRGVINLRGEPLPCLRLRDHFALPGRGAERENVVVVRHEGGRAGLVVDGLLGERQTVIKPLGPLFRALPGIAGSAILGSGRVALILDVPGLLRQTLAPSAPEA